MNILRISCSPRGHAADSHELSEHIVQSLSDRAGTAVVVDRMIGIDPVPHIDHAYLLSTPAGSLSLSEELIAELDGADALVIATPMHNLGLPSVLKAWLDHVVRAGRTFQVTSAGKIGSLRDRPVFVAVASGGRFSGAGARQPDFLTPCLTAVLGTIGLRDITYFSIQGTGLGPHVLEEARSEADRAIRSHFSSFQATRLRGRASVHSASIPARTYPQSWPSRPGSGDST